MGKIYGFVEREKMNRKILTILLLSCVVFLSGCSGGMYEDNMEGYTTVTSIEGVTFDMPETFLSQATAVSSISQDVDYSEGVYLYKNGDSLYLLFSVTSVIVVVEKDTQYNLLDSDELEESITSKPLDSVWLKKDGKKLEYQESQRNGVYKVIADVIGNTSITPEVYGKFVGKFSCIQSEGYECSMFIGIRADSNQDLTAQERKIMNHIIKSFQYSMV